MNIYTLSLRYLVPKRSLNVINVLSIISFIGIITSIMALFVILSAFNGMSEMITSSYKNLQPDLLIKYKKGNFFHFKSSIKTNLDKLQNKLSYYTTLQAKALISYNNFSSVATIKGVTEDYLKAIKLNKLLAGGRALLKDEIGLYYGILGEPLAQHLNINTNSITNIITKAPNKNFNNNSFFASNMFIRKRIKPIATFASNEEAGAGYMFTDINFARELFNEKDAISSIEVFLHSVKNLIQIKKQLINIFGDKYSIQTRDEQNESIYKILNTEKLTIYFILSFVMFIAVCNMIGSLTMLIVSKRKDIAIFSSLGFPLIYIRKIFFLSGALIVFLGSLVGLFLGLIICLLQQKFKLIMIASSGSLAHEPYPIVINISDIFIIFFIALLLSIPALLLTTKIGTKNINICKELT